jgi:3,2-trans-enoyl-CoA isomerase
MSFISESIDNGIAVVTLNRGKVNALNESLIDELHTRFRSLEGKDDIRAIILTGQGKFFSFGFDIPEFMSYAREDFKRFLIKFTDLYRYLFLYPRPVVAALNGHAIAGGCMIADACDYRIMVPGKAKISLNEITFGASVFFGSVEILKYCVGPHRAQAILFSGDMYPAEHAQQLGLIDMISAEENLMDDARKKAEELASKNRAPFGSIKRLLRENIVEGINKREAKSIEEFLDIWYSEETRKNLMNITIHS